VSNAGFVVVCYRVKGEIVTDAITISAVITGLVTALTAYMKYRVDMKQAEQKGASAPAKTEEVAKGERAMEVVKAGIEQHGNEDEHADLANFERNPKRYQDGLARVLTDIAARKPAFAQQLQTLAQHANIQTGGAHGNVNVSGEGKIYGPASGVNTGSITYAYNEKDDKHD
jgi:hypothetical protein